MPYVELHCRSAFSFLRGASAPEDLALQAADLGLAALALTDVDGLYGAVRFSQACVEVGVRPILGAEVAVLPLSPSDGRRESEAGRTRLVLLVQDAAGWKNLCRLLTQGHAGRPKGDCRVGFDELEEHSRGLACLVGEMLDSDSGEALRLLERLRAIFGRERLRVELSRHLLPWQERCMRRRLELAGSLRVEAVATNQVAYATAEERKILDLFTCIRHRVKIAEAGRLLEPNSERRLKSPAEMRELFATLPRALSAAAELAAGCRFRLQDLGYRFPAFPAPGGDEAPYLGKLVWEGAARRYGKVNERQRRQLEHELKVIRELGLAGYFLAVWDICRFCRQQGMLVQGRGSAANSAVCYALGITAVDPVAMDLLFERFLSAERGSWPDIDLDLPSGEQREKVIQYVYHRYGSERAALTAAVITYRRKSALRELGKVLGLEATAIERLLEAGSGGGSEPERTLAAAGLSRSDRRVRQLCHLWPRLERLPRHLGQHPGGMVICGGRLDEVVPLEPSAMPGRQVVQWDKDDCAEAGIIKVDLLGLGMLKVLEGALPLVRRHHGVELDLAHLPPDDPAVYDLLCRADTVGVFQVESRAQMNTLPRMRPRCFYDLVVEVAIIRPGPIVGRKVHPYLERRAGRQPVTYPHPSLKPILERTLGIPIFQEQAMRIAMEAAGYDLRQAEDLRRAMGHRRSAEYQARHQRLLREGLARRGIGGRAAEEIIESFGSFFGLYGFPESHAASFALIVYASAYLKAHFPAAFCCALLNAWPMGFYHPATVVKDAERHGVVVRPVDVSHSQFDCRLENDGAVRLGLRFVRGLHRESARRLEEERARRPWEGLEDLQRRCRLQEDELAALGELGAFGSLGLGRRQALWQAAALEVTGRPLLERLSWPEEECPLVPLSPFEETLADFRLCGLTTGPHPFAHLRPRLERLGVVPAAGLAGWPDGSSVQAAGLVIVRQRPPTAKGMTFLTLEDESGLFNVLVTPPLWRRERQRIVGAGALLVAGRLENRRGIVHLRGERFRELDGWLALEVPARNFG